MSDSLILIGGAINAARINKSAINGRVRADYTADVGGYITSVGTAPVYSYHYCHPEGMLNVVGFTIPAYGQLAVMGGYTTVADVTTDCCWGHLYIPSGYVQAGGSSDSYPMFAVQKMWTDRTAIVPSDNYREVSILPYDNLIAVLPVEEREVIVPEADAYYI